MEPKESEGRLAKMLHNYNIWSHKFEDVTKCRFCGMPGPKHTRFVDYMAVIGNKFTIIECKQAEKSFSLTDEQSGIRPIQRQILNDWLDRGVAGWIFLLMGPGDAPKEKHAYLIEWSWWLQIEASLTALGETSIPWAVNQRKMSQETNAQKLLDKFRLGWIPKIGYSIDPWHEFAITYPSLFTLQPMPYWTMEVS